MKIFGKRKNKGSASSAPKLKPDVTDKEKKSSKENENVPSYFSKIQPSTPGNDGGSSSNKKKRTSAENYNGDDMDVLLELDPAKLNSKQRRLVRRHMEREGNNTANIAVRKEAAASAKNSDGSVSKVSKGEGEKENSDKSEAEERKSPKHDSTKESKSHETSSSDCVEGESKEKDSNTSSAEILAKLDGLNSKDRRKLLRQLKRDKNADDPSLPASENVDNNLIVAAEEEARRIAERNRLAQEQEGQSGGKEGEDGVDNKSLKRKSNAGNSPAQGNGGTDETPKRKSKRRKKSAANLDDLPPEERKRREIQRQMQKEAAERRAAGLVDPNRHPLNSERRRANRRKPGKSALIAQAKKEKMSERAQFNSFGYQMRKSGNADG